MRFADTNILLYAISQTQQDAAKAAIARDVLDDRELVISVQVLGEFYVQATRVGRADRLSHDQASRLVTAFTRFRVQPLGLDTLGLAMDVVGRYGISYWDAAIVAAACLAGCDELLSEDLSHGQDYGGVTVVNPFLAATPTG